MSTRYFIYTIILLYNCGNPAITRYLEPVSKSDPKATFSQDKYNSKYKILEKNDLVIFLKNASFQDIEQLSKFEISENIAFRIPSLTYIEFYVENKSDHDFNINFFESRLTDTENNNYEVLSSQYLSRDFTSVAYRNFRYEKIFSFYITHFENAPPKNGFFYERFSPGVLTTVKSGFNGLQIVPFKKISERYEDYTLNLDIPALQEKISIPLKYIIIRADRPTSSLIK